MTPPKFLHGLPLILSTIAVSLATFLIVLDYSIANVSIPYIAGDLGVSTDEGTYVITSFAVGSAIVLPITGWLTKRWGLVKLTLYSLIGFILLSWVCGISRNLPLLVIARFLQGMAAGPLIPVSETLIVSIFPKEKKATAIGFWSTVVVIAPILGPILGGWISYDFHWPWIFFINIPFGLFAVFIIYLFLRPFETKIEKPTTDWIGLSLLAISVSTLQFLLDKGQQYDWLSSPLILSCAITSLVGFTFLLAWEYTQRDPILELRLLKIPSFNLSIIFIATMYAIYFGSVVLVPLWLQEYMNYTPIWAGFAVAPLGIFPMLFSKSIGTLAQKLGKPPLLAVSLIFFAVSSFITTLFYTDVDFRFIAFSRLLFGCGLLFFIVPLFSLSIQDIPHEKLPSATGMFHFVRAMMGGVGTSVFTTLWIRRSAFHHSNIASQINPSNPMLDSFYTALQQGDIPKDKGIALLNEMTTTQASVLGINDCFYLMGWIFIFLLVILAIKYRKIKLSA